MGQSTNALIALGIDMTSLEGETQVNDISLYDLAEKMDKDGSIAEIVDHCSGEYQMWILAIRDTRTLAWRGHPQTLDLTKMASYDLEASTSKLRQEAAKYDLPLPDDNASWLLFSMWN